MDLARRSYGVLQSSLAPITAPTTSNSSIFDTSHHIKSPSSSGTSNFPIIAIAIIGILATAFLLVSYYIFVIKCCLNWHRIDLLRRFSLSRSRNHEQQIMVYTPQSLLETHGLDESMIRSIPIVNFDRESSKENSQFCECSICLNEFEEDEKLKRIPNCGHIFHIDCIDIWLQGNHNCPLCRTSISSTSMLENEQMISPTPTPQDPNLHSENIIEDEEHVVVELENDHQYDNPTNQTLVLAQERLNSQTFLACTLHSQEHPQMSVRMPEDSNLTNHGAKLNKVSSMGDECIDIRGKDDQFSKIQPMRRSISMDSSSDRQLYLSIQEILKRRKEVNGMISSMEGCSSNRTRRNFFSFSGHSKGSKNSIMRVYLEP